MSETYDPRDQGESAVQLDLAARLIRAAGARETPPPALEARARAVVEAHWRARTTAAPARPRFLAGMALPIAATLAIAAAVALWWMRAAESPTDARSASAPLIAPDLATVAFVRGNAIAVSPSDMDTPRPLAIADGIPAAARVETRADALVALALDPRTSIRLAPESVVVFTGRGRLELEQGAVYVDRRGGEAAGERLEIHSRFGVVSEIGTQFDVALTGDGLRARVREGAVALTIASERHVAAAGTELEWSTTGGLARREVSPFGEAWSWALLAAPPIDLGGWTLDQVLAWITRETGREVVFADPALGGRLGAQRIDGELRLQPTSAIEMVPRLYGLTGRIDGATLVLRDSR